MRYKGFITFKDNHVMMTTGTGVRDSQDEAWEALDRLKRIKSEYFTIVSYGVLPEEA